MGKRAYKSTEYFKNGKLRYFFKSVGRTTILKVIEYADLEMVWEGKNVYNLGFGDYDVEEDDMIDNVVNNNNDSRLVFDTVLQSIPAFFKKFPGAALFVQGSDSSDEFIKECKKDCSRNCPEDVCRKSGRRIAIYRGYVNDHFQELVKTYEFWGVLKDSNTAGKYEVGKEYEVILVHQK